MDCADARRSSQHASDLNACSGTPAQAGRPASESATRLAHVRSPASSTSTAAW